MLRERFCDVPLEPYLARFVRAGASPVRASRYRLAWVVGCGYDDSWTKCFSDGSCGLILLRKGAALAIVSWDVLAWESLITVRQIQGVQGKREYLKAFRWEKMLLQMAMDWASANGLKRARMYPAKSHRWSVGCADPQSMRMKYEITARRMGFRQVAGQTALERALP